MIKLCAESNGKDVSSLLSDVCVSAFRMPMVICPHDRLLSSILNVGHIAWQSAEHFSFEQLQAGCNGHRMQLSPPNRVCIHVPVPPLHAHTARTYTVAWTTTSPKSIKCNAGNRPCCALHLHQTTQRPRVCHYCICHNVVSLQSQPLP